METIKDITTEMREFADLDACTIGRDVLRRRIQHFARRIDEAVTDCNQDKMREALEDSHHLLENFAWGDNGAQVREQMRDNKTALTTPPRNCDKFSKAEVFEMLDDCSFSKEDTIEWLYATKGVNNED